MATELKHPPGPAMTLGNMREWARFSKVKVANPEATGGAGSLRPTLRITFWGAIAMGTTAAIWPPLSGMLFRALWVKSGKAHTEPMMSAFTPLATS